MKQIALLMTALFVTNSAHALDALEVKKCGLETKSSIFQVGKLDGADMGFKYFKYEGEKLYRVRPPKDSPFFSLSNKTFPSDFGKCFALDDAKTVRPWLVSEENKSKCAVKTAAYEIASTEDLNDVMDLFIGDFEKRSHAANGDSKKLKALAESFRVCTEIAGLRKTTQAFRNKIEARLATNDTTTVVQKFEQKPTGAPVSKSK